MSARHPVVEVFGPTVQGEGLDQGLPVHFIRLGGCDYRCSWCDTPGAVLPAAVRRVPRQTPEEIVQRVQALGGAPRWVVVSGGNPALHPLTELVERLHEAAFSVAVETQGSRWPTWLEDCDRVCISPKGPSSGMLAGEPVRDTLTRAREVRGKRGREWAFVKVVVFNDADYAFARNIHADFPELPFYLSAGNDAGRTVGAPDRVDTRKLADVRRDLLAQSLWLTQRVLEDPDMSDVQVQSQYHVLLWGNLSGV